MSVHNKAVLEHCIIPGAGGGPGFSTSYTEDDVGRVSRTIHRARDVRRFDAGVALMEPQKAKQLTDFFLKRHGGAHAFRFPDPLDNVSGSDPGRLDNVSLLTETDVRFHEEIAPAQVGQMHVQLTKTYPDPDHGDYVRVITRPIRDTVRVSIDNGLSWLSDGAGIAVDDTTGLVVATGGWNPGVAIIAVFAYHVIGYFAKEADQAFKTRWEGANASIPPAPIIELIDHNEQPETRYYGGAQNMDILGGPIMWNLGMGSYLHGATSGKQVILPDVSTEQYPEGADVLMVHNNDTSGNFTVLDASLSTIATVVPSAIVRFNIGKDTFGVKTWFPS